MVDREKVANGVEHCFHGQECCGDIECPYYIEHLSDSCCLEDCQENLKADALELLKEQEKEIKALRLLVEWATDCDFGFDQFPEEYERYKDEITDMKYIEGMIHVAKRTLEDHGAFEEGSVKWE